MSGGILQAVQSDQTVRGLLKGMTAAQLRRALCGMATKLSEAKGEALQLRTQRDELLNVLKQVADFFGGGDAPADLEAAIHGAIARAQIAQVQEGPL